MRKPRNVIDLKKNNRSLVLEIIHHYSPISRTEIAEMTGLTRASVTNIINEFIEAGFVEEIGYHRSERGRRRRLIRIKKDAFYIVGIDISRRLTRVGVFNAAVEMLVSMNEKTPIDEGSDAVISLVERMVNETLKTARISHEEVHGVGVGIPGPLDFERGVVISPPKFRGWKEVPLRDILEGKFGIKVWVDNDANVAALGEKWLGHGKEYDNFVFLRADIGIGSGIVIDRKLYRGSLKAAGEVGHIFFKCNDEILWVEKVASFSEIARGRLKEVIDHVALTVINIANVVSPELIILGGRISAYKELVERINEMINEYLFCPKKPSVVVSMFGENAVLFGSAALALEEIVKDPYLTLLK